MHAAYTIDRVWPVSAEYRWARNLALTVLGSLLIALGARIQVPMYPVPMTMQTLAVVLVGMVLGPRWGVAAVAAYLLEGAAGLPVFASGAGPAYLLGPTAGYLVGFLAAAWLAGAVYAGLPQGLPSALAAAVLGTAVILACGSAWLAATVGPAAAWNGLAPFVLGGLVKSGMAAAAVEALRRGTRPEDRG